MSSLYSYLFGSSNTPVTLSSDPVNNYRYEYPIEVGLSGPIFLPAVYGRNLSMFEIASSGCIAFTLKDKYAFEICRSTSNSPIVFNAGSNESFLHQVNGGNVQMLLNSSNNNFEVFAQNQIVFTACNGVSFTAVDDVAYTSDRDLVFYGRCNISLVASNDINIIAHRDIYMSAKNGDVIFWLDPPNANIYFTASNSIYFNSVNGELQLLASHCNVSITFSNNNMYLYALSNIDITACNDISMNLGSSNIVQIHSEDGGEATMDINNADVHINDHELCLTKRHTDGKKVKFCFEITERDELLITRRAVDTSNVEIARDVVTRLFTRSPIL